MKCPKHIKNFPLRPIFSTWNAVTYHLENNWETRSFSYVKNTRNLIETVKSIQLDKSDLLVNFDVEPIFTNISINEAQIKHLSSRKNFS